MKPTQRVERSYSRERKIKVLLWIKYYRLKQEVPNTAIETRPPSLDEASMFFKIPRSTIARWTRPDVSEGILHECGKQSRRDTITFVCVTTLR